MAGATIFVCDDELLIRLWLLDHLAEEGYQVEAFETGGELLAAARGHMPDLVLLDLRLPDGSGIDFLEELKVLNPRVPVVMISAYGEVETAVAAVRAGAHHFLEKPVDLGELLLLIDQALEAHRLVSELDRYKEGHRWQFANVTLVGSSPAMRELAELITRLGEKGTPSTVLIQGESGTGKDVVARAIHARGPRQDQPFISVNCTALPENLIESELFGHEAGAFTDARKLKKGLFELADRGTIFLDEIGDMPRVAQSKLLDFLESRRFRRVGGVRDHEVDVHVLTATNRVLEDAVANGDFRKDLFYRLNVIPIHLSPLRDRREDIPILAAHFVETLCDDMSIPHRSFAQNAMDALSAYSWPGNAREMRNVIERVLLLSDEATIRAEHLPEGVRAGGPTDGAALHLPASGLALEDVERGLIEQALERSKGNKSHAARLLGISRDTLRYRLEKHGMSSESD